MADKQEQKSPEADEGNRAAGGGAGAEAGAAIEEDRRMTRDRAARVAGERRAEDVEEGD